MYKTDKLTILLQVRYHREKDKHRADAHEPGSQWGCTCSGSGNSNSSNKVRGEHGGYEQIWGQHQGQTNEHEQVWGVGSTANEQARGERRDHEQIWEYTNKQQGWYEQGWAGTRGGAQGKRMNEHWGMNKCGQVQMQQGQQQGLCALRPPSPLPLPPFFLFLYYSNIIFLMYM